MYVDSESCDAKTSDDTEDALSLVNCSSIRSLVMWLQHDTSLLFYSLLSTFMVAEKLASGAGDDTA